MSVAGDHQARGSARVPGEPANSWDRLRAHLVKTYLTADLRSLALGRIVMSLVLLVDLAKRCVAMNEWYTNEGLLPNHTLLWRPSFDHEFSLFFACSYAPEVIVGFIICGVCYTALLLGVWTKRAQVASLFCLLNLHGRLLLVDNGGDVVLGLLCIWTTFLPTGRRFSVDAVLARHRPRPPEPPLVAPVDVFGAAAPGRSAPSLGMWALTFQFAFIYFFNALHKHGGTWLNGTAVHYVLHLDRLVTWFGVWLRHRMTLGLSRVMTYSALGTEWSLPFLLISPIAVRYCRRLAILLVIGLHAGFGVCMNLGIFVPAMIAYTPNFIYGDDWDQLAAWWARSPGRVQRLARLEEWLTSRILRASDFLSPGRWARTAAPGPAVTALLRRVPVAREVVVFAFLIIASSQLLDENAAAHDFFDHHNSPAMSDAVHYLNLFQGWSMFAPEAFTSDVSMIVDAVTVDGRHVDPFNEASNPRYPNPGVNIPPAMGNDWLFYQYVGRLASWPAYQSAFQDWILRYPERTGRASDQIVSFKVSRVEDDSPPPGETEPRNARATLMFQYPR
jgi:hypothetical protein